MVVKMRCFSFSCRPRGEFAKRGVKLEYKTCNTYRDDVENNSINKPPDNESVGQYDIGSLLKTETETILASSLPLSAHAINHSEQLLRLVRSSVSSSSPSSTFVGKKYQPVLSPRCSLASASPPFLSLRIITEPCNSSSGGQAFLNGTKIRQM